jgi:hypothetical protein
LLPRIFLELNCNEGFIVLQLQKTIYFRIKPEGWQKLPFFASKNLS